MAFAQTSVGTAPMWVIAVTVSLLLIVLLVVGDNLLRIEAHRSGLKESTVSILPSLGELAPQDAPKHAEGGKIIKIRQGHDIKLEGDVEDATIYDVHPSTFAVRPVDFHGLQPIPKMQVSEGERVRAGDALFFDKQMPEVMFASPVSGEVIEIRRGEKRAITGVVILADKTVEFKAIELGQLEDMSRDEVAQAMMANGLWPMLRRRPYNVVADPAEKPKAIFISTFDSAPLAMDSNKSVKGNEAEFQKGLDALVKLADGAKVHLGLNANAKAMSAAFAQAQGVEKHWFKGPHPAGNVGVQIHYIDPINAGDVVWTLSVDDTIALGRLFLHGRFDTQRVVAVVGAELNKPRYVRTYQGANVEALLAGNLKGEGKKRIVSGDVLTGTAIPANGFLTFFENQLTVIAEGDYYEPFGWLLPLSLRPSLSKTFPNFLFPDYKFRADTNTHGEARAFVVTNQYERLLPMDIYLQHLMKSIIIKDVERMEGLGIYELVEEDVALCEFSCTSKAPLQSLLREGLEMMRAQG